MAVTLGDLDIRVWDCEVFQHDWLFVIKDSVGNYDAFWNDPDGFADYMSDNGDSVFVGFNSKHYDSYIAKAILAGCDPEQVKEVNDWIISGNTPWEHPYLRGFYYWINNADLMDDTMRGTSLKSIEGHLGMSVEETTVDFTVTHKLSDQERDEVERYCRHDVDATERLLELRTDYLETKLHLADMAGIDPKRALGMTDPMLAAAFMGAERQEFDDERQYEFPDRLDYGLIPRELVEFFKQVWDESIPDEELWKKKLVINIGGCDVTYGFGGLHGALDKFVAKATEDTLVLCFDVSSLYPSLMIEYGYVSRSVPNPATFANVRAERFAAKKRGDKQTANALKSPLNKAYGAMLNQYNPMYDPKMARSVCISGMLSMTELAVAYTYVDDLQLYNINTDGIMFTIPADKYEEVLRINEWWQAHTHLELEEDRIAFMWQKDVNNYCARFADGHEKIKGAYLVRGISPIGAWSINNNAIVVAEALRAYLLDGVPVRQTIEACNDPFKFQLIAKAGHKYSRVYQLIYDALNPEQPAEVPMQRCNRVFASTDDELGRLYKVKAADGRVAKVESLPEHCLVRNDGMPDMSEIDKQWYVALAERRAHDFEKEERRKMATTTKAPDYKSMNVWQKLATARLMVDEANPTKSGLNDYDGWTYMELGDIVPLQNKIFAEVGLLEQFTYHKGNRETFTDAAGNSTVTDEQPYAVSRVVNVDDPSQVIEFCLPWLDIEPIVTNAGKKKQNAVQMQGSVQTYLRRYIKMQVLDLAMPDEIEPETGSPTKEPAKNAEASKAKVSTSKRPTAKAPAKATSQKPATVSQRKETAKGITAADSQATKMQIRQLTRAIKTLKDAYGSEPEVSAAIAEIGAKTGNLKGEFTKKDAEGFLRQLGELKQRLDSEGGAE